LAAPSFDSAALAAGRLISRGYQGEVYLVGSGARRLIVKKAMGMLPLRMIRRRMLRREHAVYRRLAGIRGVPRCFGLYGDDCLVLEYVAGQSYRLAGKRLQDRERFFTELLEIIRSLHRAGIAHADMKRKQNILVSESGHPCLIDFGAAVVCGEGAGTFRRMMFHQASRIDLNAWVKLKYMNHPEQISAADRRLYRPTPTEIIARTVRRLWQAVTFRKWRHARRGR